MKKKIFLILLLAFLPLMAFSQTIIPEDGQSLITNTTIKFYTIIENVRPGQVTIENPTENENVVYKVLRRSEEYSEPGGTRIEISLSFKKSGTYQLEPLRVIIKGKTKKLPFEPLVIKENPMELVPLLVVKFKNGQTVSSKDSSSQITVRAGDKIYFTLCLQYAVQLVQYSWDLPKDSIFTELKQYEITEIKNRDKVYSEALIPVADFEWIPLVEGRMDFPQFKLTATGYNGVKTNLALPQFYINVTKAKTSAGKTNNNSSLFDDAFAYDIPEEKTAAKVEITDSICQRIADLRARERHTLSLTAARERADYEKSLSLPYEQKEFHVILLILALVMVVAIGFFLVLFICRKMPLAYIFMGVLEVCSIVFLIYSIVQSSARHGISRGCKIYSIPEEKAESKSEIPAGNRITITEESGNWIYVELGENGGWCIKDQVIEIK